MIMVLKIIIIIIYITVNNIKSIFFWWNSNIYFQFSVHWSL